MYRHRKPESGLKENCLADPDYRIYQSKLETEGDRGQTSVSFLRGRRGQSLRNEIFR